MMKGVRWVTVVMVYKYDVKVQENKLKVYIIM